MVLVVVLGMVLVVVLVMVLVVVGWLVGSGLVGLGAGLGVGLGLDSLGFPCKQGTHVAHRVKVLSLVRQDLLFKGSSNVQLYRQTSKPGE